MRLWINNQDSWIWKKLTTLWWVACSTLLYLALIWCADMPQEDKILASLFYKGQLSTWERCESDIYWEHLRIRVHKDWKIIDYKYQKDWDRLMLVAAIKDWKEYNLSSKDWDKIYTEANTIADKILDEKNKQK